jgi:uncharacterized HAD superfamily protein
LERWKAWETLQITKDEFFRTLDEAWFDWRAIPPTEEHIDEKVGRLLEFGKVDIVTGRSLETVTAAKSWLKERAIRFNSFVRTEKGKDKAKLNYDVFVDDSPELMSQLSSGSRRHGILYTQPWNKEYPIRTHISRVNSWNQIPGVVQKIVNANRLQKE